MTYQDFMQKLIDIGIEAARLDYAGAGEFNTERLAGSLDGFMECRGKSPIQIGELLEDSEKKAQQAFTRLDLNEISRGEYWRVRCRAIEIEWVTNCVSALLASQGLEPIIPYSSRAVLTVAKIIGVRAE